MATALTRRQANVTAVSSAGEAIQAITRKRPDVLVSDIAMPDEDGYGLIEKVRLLENGESQSIPAVAITAYAKEEDRERALSSGFQIYLAKPVELTELVSVVARAARREFLDLMACSLDSRDRYSVGLHGHGLGQPVVLLHGYPFNRSLWNEQVSALSNSYRVDHAGPAGLWRK